MSDDFAADLEEQVNRELLRLHARDKAAFIYGEAKRQTSTSRSRQHDGASFFLDLPATPPALWGKGSEILWADGEPLMIAGDDGTGKTTIVHQLMAARMGLFDELLGQPVARTSGKVLYLAMDRPEQARRAGTRVFQHLDPVVLKEGLATWNGPLPVDILKSPSALADWIAEEFGTGISEVYADSMKDMAAKISDDGVGAGINSAIQEVIARGINWVGLHHNKKAQSDNRAPNTLADLYGSRWLTAGHGSVLFIERPKDQADNDVIMVRQLKEPMDKMKPLLAKHDRPAGRTNFIMAVSAVAQQVQSELKQRISDYLQAGGSDGRVQKDICAVIGGTKMKVTKALEEMHINDDLKLKRDVKLASGQKGIVYWHPMHAPGDAV